MDNVTHSLIGVLLGRIAAPYVGSARGAIVAAILASNLPDIDFAWIPLYGDPKLAYLIHHRGYTHTLLLAVPLAVACTLLVRQWAKEVHLGWTFLLSLVGLMLHVGADGWNNYGVHPFWPLDAHWHYGDSIFIVEPWLWASLGPLAMVLAGKRLRVLLAGLGLAGGAALAGMVGPGMAAAWAGITLGMGFLQFWRQGSVRLAAAGTMLVLAGFEAGSVRAEVQVEDAMAAQASLEEVLEVARTPMPGQPWCWSFIAVSLGPGGAYHLRPGTLSLLESVDARSCSLRETNNRSLHLRPPDLSDTSRLHWEGEWGRPVQELRDLVHDCRVDGFLRFARTPWWVEEEGQTKLGDLRYDFEPGEGFAEVTIPRTPPTECMALPAWRSRTVERLLRER